MVAQAPSNDRVGIVSASRSHHAHSRFPGGLVHRLWDRQKVSQEKNVSDDLAHARGPVQYLQQMVARTADELVEQVFACLS